MTATSLLRFFEVDIPSNFSESESNAMLEYADAQEAPSLARLALLRQMWRKLNVQPKGMS
jgi:hypothetical protein